jgi:2-polyprenyl-3-methyl-5-hydroxy-6-metoxy-1,4-benzoquinol methylase
MSIKQSINQLLGRFGYRIIRESTLQSLQTQQTDPRAAWVKEELLQTQNAILHQIRFTNDNLYLHLNEARRVRELYYRDTMLVLDRLARFIPRPSVKLDTTHKLAADTDDHKFPWGTMQDNTRSPRFVAACERYFAVRGEPTRALTCLDLGCSGGGLVLDFLLRGHEAYGIEGSDYSQRAQRAEWRMLPENLFTGDIASPFTLKCQSDGHLVRCDVITAWEVMEHLADEDLPQLFDNVLRHLKPNGLFIGSICTVPDDNPKTGAVYHRTVQPRAWWENRFAALGMRIIEDHGFLFQDFCRGTQNGLMDGSYADNPEIGFHYVAVKCTT